MKVTGSPHSQATPGSPVASSVSFATTVESAAGKTPPTHHSPGEQTTAATPPTADQAAEESVCVCVCVCVCI